MYFDIIVVILVNSTYSILSNQKYFLSDLGRIWSYLKVMPETVLVNFRSIVDLDQFNVTLLQSIFIWLLGYSNSRLRVVLSLYGSKTGPLWAGAATCGKGGNIYGPFVNERGHWKSTLQSAPPALKMCMKTDATNGSSNKGTSNIYCSSCPMFRAKQHVIFGDVATCCIIQNSNLHEWKKNSWLRNILVIHSTQLYCLKNAVGLSLMHETKLRKAQTETSQEIIIFEMLTEFKRQRRWNYKKVSCQVWGSNPRSLSRTRA